MNKNEFVSKLTAFAIDNGYDLSDIVVSHGGSALLMGLRETTNDIDVAVSINVWNDFVAAGHPIAELGDGIQLIVATTDIDIHHGMPVPKRSNMVTEEGIHYHGMLQTLDDYVELGRDKDLVVIAQIKTVLGL